MSWALGMSWSHYSARYRYEFGEPVPDWICAYEMPRRVSLVRAMLRIGIPLSQEVLIRDELHDGRWSLWSDESKGEGRDEPPFPAPFDEVLQAHALRAARHLAMEKPMSHFHPSMAGTLVASSLIAAYEKTEYRVLGPHPFTLRIGQESAELAEEYQARGVRSCAFLTACNPYSRDVGAPTNARNQERLEREIVRRGLACMPGIGVDPDVQYPGEASFLVFGLAYCEGRVVGRKFRQNAIIWCDGDAVPQLVMLK